jgi:hypothetical protein
MIAITLTIDQMNLLRVALEREINISQQGPWPPRHNDPPKFAEIKADGQRWLRLALSVQKIIGKRADDIFTPEWRERNPLPNDGD